MTERCDAQILRMLRAMFDTDPKQRPNAEQVWKALTICTTGKRLYFCGPCCMPLLHDDPLLERAPLEDPATSNYMSPNPTKSISSITRDLYFRTEYTRDQDFGLDWERNVRHFDHSILDIVSGESAHYLARKRITSLDHPQGPMLALNEAEILRTVDHRHVVKLYSTYRQGNTYGLLYEPAAKYDLRSFMELIEIKRLQGHDVSADILLLTRSLGCMASALDCVHDAGYDHGDLRPENILVHEKNILLSKFSFGLKFEDSGILRMLNDFGKFYISRQAAATSVSGRPSPSNPAAVSDASPIWYKCNCLIANFRRITNPQNGDLKSEQRTAGPMPIYSRLDVSSSRSIRYFKGESSLTFESSELMISGEVTIAIPSKKHQSGWIFWRRTNMPRKKAFTRS